MAIDYQKTGRAISAYRQELKLSQQGLAELMNVTHQAVSKWENGAALPDTPTLLALSKLFGVSMEDLLMGEIREKKAETPEKTDDAPHAIHGLMQRIPTPIRNSDEMTMNTAQKEMEQAEKANREEIGRASCRERV